MMFNIRSLGIDLFLGNPWAVDILFVPLNASGPVFAFTYIFDGI